MSEKQQIIAMGGGGFGSEPGNLRLDRYILAQANVACPHVCFVPTASGDNDQYLRRFYESFCTLNCVPRHLSLFRPPSRDLQSYVMDHHVVYVGGGNTHNMLLLWRDWQLDRILRGSLEHGIVLAGISAGSICWFEQGVTDSFTPVGSETLAAMDCLGFLAGSNCPHYDGEPWRRPEYHRLIKEGQMTSGWAADDGIALHFVDGALFSIVSSRRNASAYRVELTGEEVVETKADAIYLAAQ